MVQLINTYGSLLLTAMGQTLLLALWGLFFGCILGIVFGLASVVDNKVSRIISKIYVNVIRGVPMIVLAFFVFYGVPYGIKSFFGAKFVLTPLQAGTVCLALNCGAYMSEIIRAGIQAIDPGQMEASRSLGLSYWRSMFRVVLPQAIKNMIPSIVNQFIITLKDTSILSVIGFPELVNKAQNVIAITFKSFEMWAIVAIMYLVVILALQQVANALERRLNRGREK
ncbi:MAG: amino acid ABC transporter permease [Clostridia bacterium]|nr:amino acid ABC transporter permease [Clostridia bacterium]